MKLYSISDIAKLDGVINSSVRRWCQANGIAKVGNGYILTEEQYAEFKKRRKPGRYPTYNE